MLAQALPAARSSSRASPAQAELLRTRIQPAARPARSLCVRTRAMGVQAPSKPVSKACSSVTAKTVADAVKEIGQIAKGGADIVELRLDFLTDLNAERDIPALLGACTIPAIVTFRPVWEGGLYDGDEQARLKALLHAAKSGATYIDVELKAAERFSQLASPSSLGPTTLILSSHNFQTMPALAELRDIHSRATVAGAGIVKIAAMAKTITDVDVMAQLMREVATKKTTIALAMGEAGQVSRLLAPKLNSYLTFGALGAGKESAPGQPRLEDLKNRYRLSSQGANTRCYGVIGKPISHSRSPLIHNAALSAAGVDAVYVPLLVDDLAAFLGSSMVDQLGFDGFSVTIPHKEAALKACKEVDPVAAQIGAVNTLVRLPGGGWKGYNTDWLAAIDTIEQGLGGAGALKGKAALVVGAGGAGRALAFGAKQRGAGVLVANRSLDRAQALAAEVGGQAVPWEDLQQGRCRADVLINTTALGMAPEPDTTPAPAEALKAGGFKLVFDAVYTPLETRLLREAKAAGAATVSGLGMFVGQAEEQYRLFTGKAPPAGVMRETLLAALKG